MLPRFFHLWRAFVLAILFATHGGSAVAEPRTFGSGEAIDYCNRWLNGTLTGDDVNLDGFRTYTNSNARLMFIQAGPAQTVRAVQFTRDDTEQGRLTRCLFIWAYDSMEGHAQQATIDLRAAGFASSPQMDTQGNTMIEGVRGDLRATYELVRMPREQASLDDLLLRTPGQFARARLEIVLRESGPESDAR